MPKFPRAQCPVTGTLNKQPANTIPCLCSASWNPQVTLHPDATTDQVFRRRQYSTEQNAPFIWQRMSKRDLEFFTELVVFFLHWGTFSVERSLSTQVTQLNKQHRWFITPECASSGWWPVWCWVSSSPGNSLNKWHQQRDSVGRTTDCKSPTWVLAPNFSSPASFFSALSCNC